MGTRTQHTKTDLSRLCCAVVVGCATRATRSWLEARRPASCASPVRWQQPALANELVRPLLVRRFFCCCGAQATVCACTVAPRVCCLQLVPQRRRPAALRARCRAACVSCFAESQKPRRYWPKIDFFLNCFWKFDFRLAFSATRISRRRPVLRLLLLLCLAL